MRFQPLLGAEHAKVLGDREGMARALAQALISPGTRARDALARDDF